MRAVDRLTVEQCSIDLRQFIEVQPPRRNLTLPVTVDAVSFRPPDPMVPRHTPAQFLLNGKSEDTLPVTALA
jgi:hypothetical protein